MTNSDYIMERMLKNSKVSNVSGSYLSENKAGTAPGIPLNMGDSKVIFGYILHRGEEMDESIQEVNLHLFHNTHKVFNLRIAQNPPTGLCAFLTFARL